MRILIVDDAAIVRSLLRITLEHQGHEVLDASDVSSALEIFFKERPDFVLTDLNLSGDSGLRLFSELSKSFPDVPVVLLTASELEEDRRKALSMGMRDVLRKPIKSVELSEVIKKNTSNEPREHKIFLSLPDPLMTKARALAKEKSIAIEVLLNEIIRERLSK